MKIIIPSVAVFFGEEKNIPKGWKKISFKPMKSITIEERADKQFLKETHMDVMTKKTQRDFLNRGRKTFAYSIIALRIAFRDMILAIKNSLKLK